MSKTAERKAARAAAVVAARSADDARGPGRPSEYDPSFCDVVRAAGKLGKSKAEIAAELSVTRSTLDAWAAAHEEFSDAVQEAHDASLAWWEAMARNNVDQGPKVNASLWSRSMSGRFPAEPYRERTEVSGPGGGPIQTDGGLGEELAKLPKVKRDAIRAAIAGAMEDKEG